MKEILFVFLGGGLGSIARFLISKAYATWNPAFPFATLTANFLSCIVLGFVMMLGAEKLNLSPAIRLLILTGFCGGFSTYSSFTFETVELFKTGSNLLAISNIVLNFFLSVTGLYLGIAAAKFL